jgi:hypothetical protein
MFFTHTSVGFDGFIVSEVLENAGLWNCPIWAERAGWGGKFLSHVKVFCSFSHGAFNGLP